MTLLLAYQCQPHLQRTMDSAQYEVQGYQCYVKQVHLYSTHDSRVYRLVESLQSGSASSEEPTSTEKTPLDQRIEETG